MVSIQSTALNHQAHNYHFQWYLTTVNQQPLRMNLHQQLSLKIALNFSITTIVSGVSPSSELDRSTLMEFHNLPPKRQKLNVLYVLLPKQPDTNDHQHQLLTPDQHQDPGKTSILTYQAKCAYHPSADIDTLQSSYAHGQEPNIANFLPTKIISSTHIVDSWQLPPSSHTTFALYEQIKEENSSTILCKLSSPNI